MTIGLNILGDRGVPESTILDAVNQLNAKFFVIMNNAALAAKIQALGKGTVIYRDHDGDDNAQDRVDPVVFVQRRHAAAPPGALLYLGNEPYPTQRLADWTLAAMAECERLGRRGVILNFPTGNPEPADWQRFRPVLQRAVDKGHILGLHEYFDVTYAKDYPYHVGRFLKLKELGLPVPKIVITELGACIGFQPLRGYRWAGAMTDDQYGAELARVSKEVYAPRGVHTCVFAFTSDDSSDDWQSFNPRPRVIELMSAYNKTEDTPVATVPAPTTGGVVARLTKIPGDYINIRSQPNGADVGDLYVGDAGVYYPTAPADGWVYFNADKGVKGWVSLQAGAVVFTPVVVEPPGEENTIPLTADQFSELKALHAQVGAWIQEVEASGSGGGF